MTDCELVVDETVSSRTWTAAEIQQIAQVGGMELVTRYGAMDSDVPVSHSQSWRDIPVLRRP